MFTEQIKRMWIQQKPESVVLKSDDDVQKLITFYMSVSVLWNYTDSAQVFAKVSGIHYIVLIFILPLGLKHFLMSQFHDF